MKNAKDDRLLNATLPPPHAPIENHVVEIVPKGRDGRCNNGDDTNIGSMHSEPKGPKRDDKQKANNFKADCVANAVTSCIA